MLPDHRSEMFLLDADHDDDIGVSGSNKVLMSLENEESVVKRRRTCSAYDQREPSKIRDTYNVLSCILDQLLELIDYVRFAAVCKEWHGVAKDYNHTIQRWRRNARQLPMLMLPPNIESQGNDEQPRRLYSVSERRIYNHLNSQLSVPYYEKFCGSSHGWLASVHKPIPIQECQQQVEVFHYITLRNPFANASEPIQFPPYTHCIPKMYYDFKNWVDWIPKVILSADPTLHPDDYYVLLAFYRPLPNYTEFFTKSSYSPSLALIKGGQNSWITINRPVRYYPKFDDAIFYKNKFYLIHEGGHLLITVDVNSSSNNLFSPIEKSIYIFPNPGDIFPSDIFPGIWGQYLVESTNGDLLLVLRRFYQRETSFRVCKIVFNDQDASAQLVEVHCIGDDALFLGQSHSVSVLASKFPGCQPNSIYYATEDVKRIQCHTDPEKFDGGKNEMGIFNLGDTTITPLLDSGSINNWNWNNMNMPLWVLPSLDGLLGS